MSNAPAVMSIYQQLRLISKLSQHMSILHRLSWQPELRVLTVTGNGSLTSTSFDCLLDIVVGYCLIKLSTCHGMFMTGLCQYFLRVSSRKLLQQR